MNLSQRQRNLLNLVVRCYDRTVGAARLDPLMVEFELDAPVPAILGDLEVLQEEGILQRAVPGDRFSGAETEWLLAPTDRGALLAMGIGDEAGRDWPEDEGGTLL